MEEKSRIIIFRQLSGDAFSEAFVEYLELHKDSGTGIRVVEKLEGIEAVLQEETVVSVVFPSRRWGLLPEAQTIKEKYPDVRVVILTALLPDEYERKFIPKDLIFVEKGVIPERMREAVFASGEISE